MVQPKQDVSSSDVALILERIIANEKFFPKEALDKFFQGGTLHVKIATVCSGTEAPVFALNLTQQALYNLRGGSKQHLKIDHIFSCENVVFKQVFILNNSRPRELFSDVINLSRSDRGGEA